MEDPAAAQEGQPGTLRVFLPGGRLLLQHAVEPVRWLPLRQGFRALEGFQACGAQGGVFDGVTGRCNKAHAVARLCYAVSPDAGPWDGALVSDCEHAHRSPLYQPLERRRSAEEKVEIILRSRMDA